MQEQLGLFSPQVESSGVDAGAVRKQPVEHGGLPSHVERRQHQPPTGEPRLVADPVCDGRLQDEQKVQPKRGIRAVSFQKNNK